MSLGFINVIEITSTVGVEHSTGVVPFDLNNDHVTDLVFMPGTFNTGMDKLSFAVVSSGQSVKIITDGLWTPAYKTGFVKDWWVEDVSNDGSVELLWIDHGAEFPAELGGFENGFNGLLVNSTAGAQTTYQQLFGDKAFNHGGVLLTLPASNQKLLLVTDFTNKVKAYSFSDLANPQVTYLDLGSDFGWAPPGAIGAVRMQNGTMEVVLPSSGQPNSWDPVGHFGFYRFDGAQLNEVNRISFDETWIKVNESPFKIISGDFRGVGYDDFIALGETNPVNGYIRDALYYEQRDGQFVEATSAHLGLVANLINRPDKLVSFDVNQDGHLDLLGFSYQSGLYTSGAGLFINNGLGEFHAVAWGDATLQRTNNWPIFSTNADGSWNELVGLYGVSTPDTTHVAVQQWLAETALSTGPGFLNPALRDATGFNEFYYLDKYADAASAVHSGSYSSALDYYLSVGKQRGDQICAPDTQVVGSDRIDTFYYHSERANFRVSIDALGLAKVTDLIGSYGTNVFDGVERLSFIDSTLALDITGIAGQAYRIYKAAFDRMPDAGGLGFWINALDKGGSLLSVSHGFISSTEFKSTYGDNPTDQYFVTQLYNHVLHRKPEGEGYQFWLNSLASGVSRAQVLKEFSESGENIAQTAELIVTGIQYDEWQG